MATCSIGWALVLGAAIFVATRLLLRRRCHRGRGGGPGRSRFLRGIFARLDTTPGQEREIRAAIEELQTQARSAREKVRGAREGLARALRGDAVDDAAFVELRARAEDVASEMHRAFEAALRRVHAILDPAQRERLAALLERGPFGRWGGPYRA
jgi:Spy/CpxP family protein refolding chaperone